MGLRSLLEIEFLDKNGEGIYLHEACDNGISIGLKASSVFLHSGLLSVTQIKRMEPISNNSDLAYVGVV